MIHQQHVLWLASWYPSAIDELQGDFIQRHAFAVSQLVSIELWTFIEDKNGLITHDHTLRQTQCGNLTENRVYYYTGNLPKGRIFNALRIFRMLNIAKQHLNKRYPNQVGLPRLVHTHIMLNAGMLGHWFCQKHQVPHMLSEQWTAYLNEARPNFRNLNPWSKWQWKRMVKHASVITAVSQYLAKRLQELSNGKPIIRVPNVVDGSLFVPQPVKNRSLVRFITISADSFQKNMDGVLDAVKLVVDELGSQASFELQIVHHPDALLKEKIERRCIGNWVKLLKPVTHIEIASLIAQSDALLLYSRYETFGCVVIEALATGVPVIASNIPVLRELVIHGKNGLLANVNDSAHLAKMLISFIKGAYRFESEHIRSEVLSSYSYKVVSKQFVEIYQSLSKVPIMLRQVDKSNVN
jgi:glycosyltransferase involved in cell wall biosynthesis